MFTTLPDSSSKIAEGAETIVERWLASDNPETLAMAYRRLTGELRERALARLQAIDGAHDLGDGVDLDVEDGGVANGGNELWFRNGWLHRDDGPAEIRGGGVAGGGSETWFCDSAVHRSDGPAYLWTSKGFSRKVGEAYYLNGKQVREEDLTAFTQLGRS